MTLRSRNRVIDLFFFLIVTTIVYLAYELLRTGPIAAEVNPRAFLFVLIRSLIPLFLGFMGLLGFYRYFRKVTGVLIFFFFLSLFSLVFDAAGLFSLLLGARDLSFDGVIVLSRANLFGLILGTLAIAAASMYVAGLSYQNQGTALSIILISSYLMAQEVPLATSLPSIGGLFAPIPKIQLGILWGTAAVLILLNFLRSAYGNRSKDEILLGLSVLSYLGGRVLLNGAESIATLILGSVLLILGATYYSRKVFEFYLWY